MTDDLIKYFGDTSILNLGEIVRYNNRQKIKSESVATHSWIASVNVLKICQQFNIPANIKAQALEMIVVHDIPECSTNDLPYDFKQRNPELRGLLEKAELEFLKTDMPEFYPTYKKLIDLEKEEDLAALIVKLADAISVLQYSNNEIILGNLSDCMREINEESVERITRLIEKIEAKSKNLNDNIWRYGSYD